MKQIKTIQKMPKVDLHVHLGGCFTQSDLWVLSQKYCNLTKEQFSAIFNFHSFDDFSAAWKFKNSLIRTYNDFSFLMDGVVNYIKRENIVYWEPAIAMFEFESLDPARVLDIADKKLKESGAHYSFIMDLIRGDGASKMKMQYNFYNSLSKYYPIRGVGIAGNEKKHGLSLELVPIIAKAKADGYGITIHASEQTGHIFNIKLAVENFKVDRIGHANYMNICTDRVLVERILRDGIHLEFIPSSLARWSKHGEKQVVGEVQTYLHADILNYINGAKYGLDIPKYRFSVNSDDPGMFGKSLSYILSSIGCCINEYNRIMHMANEASFAPLEMKKIVKSALQIL